MKSLKLLFAGAVLAWSQSGGGVKEVTYEVDGTAKYAALTLTNKDGGREQNTVKLPFELKFYARPGSFVYLSAQTTRVVDTFSLIPQVIDDGITGTVHVLVRVSGAVVQEATSSSPYGIATAEGKVPE